ncbi:unnamed protein product [Closterium sp. Yama58-4]|nr:unnamed protein product [Closterium sp. Yama58-4]
MWDKAEAWGFQSPGEYNRDVLRAALAQPSTSLRFTWGRRSKRARDTQEQPSTWQLSWPVQREGLEMRAGVQLRAVEGEEQQRAAVGRILDVAMRGAAAAQVGGEEQQGAAVGRILDEAMTSSGGRTFNEGMSRVAAAQAEQQCSREACGRMQREAERCLQQSERFREEKSRLEDELLGKVCVLCSRVCL